VDDLGLPDLVSGEEEAHGEGGKAVCVVFADGSETGF
jgi:hypothetical protein